MRRTLSALLLSFTMVIALQAQLPANLDCKCTATGDGEYLCKCVPSKGSETLGKGLVKPTAASTPFVLPEPPATTLRANMAETLLAPLITEQGGKDIQHEEYEDIRSGAVGRAQ